MKMGDLGQIVVAPFRVEGAEHLKGSYLALSESGSEALNVWVSGRGQYVSRVIVDKSTLRTIGIVHTRLKSLGPISVTNKTSNNAIAFMITSSRGRQIASYPLDDLGHLTGPRIILSPPLRCVDRRGALLFCGGGLSSDGRTAFFSSSSVDLYTQHLYVEGLDSVSHPITTPLLLDNLTSTRLRVLEGLDARENAKEGTKWFFYHREVFEEGSLNQMFLQKLDAASLQPSGLRIRFSAANKTVLVLVDPLAHFVLLNYFTVKSGGTLYYLALDNSGHPVGKQRLMIRSPYLISPQDILRERN